ncbi:MAG: FAD-dependent oxidoreductase [Elusimicrobia bacterium GWC2_51_8]|nr:MAG: FAD-dependent oxidoreductase [Elusimicrobia bacterium GWA2_51_34]OGR60659.1 MAG: FAD-dependent oxidoreductase [Elusimicrobia bacterium GWC2_51_8]HAF96534.1 L-2-hydroxyglutarate oxidase [Elusimicrobiota bacterium]HCE97612.1 L-2-hydroxyglutarate oxidase [Elusimicrobiota bacterium]
MQTKKTDYLMIGAGIIGLTLAKQLKERFPDKKIIILEKEPDVACHSSGRNSGVLHSGFYYTADSLKARFTRDGNRLMKEYCKANGLALNECGKVVVASNEGELKGLYELERRGKANGVDVRLINEKELATIEPNAKTFKHALYSPSTATVDPVGINLHIKNSLLNAGVEIRFCEGYAARSGANTVRTSSGALIEAEKIINAAGLYADKIARDFGYSQNYVIIPFKGIYLKYDGGAKTARANIYPVPDLKNPFLGVHFTVTVDGTVKIGPTAIPAFWRENYQGLDNFRLGETMAVMYYEARLFLTNSFGFRNLAFEEMRKYYKPYFIGLGKKLVRELDPAGFRHWSKPGIRAQLLNTKTLELLQDFVVEGDKNSVHILNAVSPAFTSSFPFTRWVIDNHLN